MILILLSVIHKLTNSNAQWPLTVGTDADNIDLKHISSQFVTEQPTSEHVISKFNLPLFALNNFSLRQTCSERIWRQTMNVRKWTKTDVINCSCHIINKWFEICTQTNVHLQLKSVDRTARHTQLAISVSYIYDWQNLSTTN